MYHSTKLVPHNSAFQTEMLLAPIIAKIGYVGHEAHMSTFYDGQFRD